MPPWLRSWRLWQLEPAAVFRPPQHLLGPTIHAHGEEHHTCSSQLQNAHNTSIGGNLCLLPFLSLLGICQSMKK
jgi:hypothetical protein